LTKRELLNDGRDLSWVAGILIAIGLRLVKVESSEEDSDNDDCLRESVGMWLHGAKTIVEWAERMRSAGPPTKDDVTVLLDGRRLNSRETVEARLKEVEAIRVLDAATGDSALQRSTA